jgi:hypothetical protein
MEMAQKNARDELVQFLDEKVFDPILDKSEADFSSEDQKEKFRDVRRSTESEKHRFHDEYTSAQDVKDNYLSDLSSNTGKKKDEELEDLGLPKLPDVRDEFMELCDKLGVK